VTMLNQAVPQRAQPPTRSSSLRSQSSTTTTSSLTVSEGGAGTAPAAKPSAATAGTRLAVELQRLHELKRQVAAQEQRLAGLRTLSSAAETNGTIDGKGTFHPPHYTVIIM